MSTDLAKLTEAQKATIVAELEKQYRDARSNQREARRKWAKVEHYLAGRQYWVNNTAGRLGRPVGYEVASAPSATGDIDDEFMIANDIKRVYMTNMQRLTNYYLVPDVQPNTRAEKDKQAARLGRIFLNDLFTRYGPEKLKKEIARNKIIYNKAWLKIVWNPTAGKLVPKATKGIKGWFFNKKEMVPEGDIEITVPSPRNTILPRFTSNRKQMDWMIEIHSVTTEQIYRRYGTMVQPEAVRSDDLGISGTGAGWVDDPESEGRLRGSSEETMDRALLKEMWVRPCSQYEQGAIFAWANGTLLESRPLTPYYTDIPYFDTEIFYDDKDIFGISILWDLLPQQDVINLGYSAVTRWLKMISQLRMWVPSSCNVKTEDLNNNTGTAILYDGEARPEWDPVPAIPESVMQSIGLARDFMSSHGFANELAKQHQTASGNALGIMQEMDDTIFKPSLESDQLMLSEAGTFMLQLAAKYIKMPRLIEMSGRDGWQVKEGFIGEMLSGNFRAKVNVAAGMPSNKILRLEYLKALFKDGLMDKDQLVPYLEFPDDNSALEDIQKQNEIGDMRIEQLKKFPENYTSVPSRDGSKVYVCNVKYHQFDNHAVLTAKLTLAMQEDFDHWNPWVQLAFLDNWKYHSAQLAALSQPPPQPGGGMPMGGPPGAPPMGPGGPPPMGMGMPPTPTPPLAEPLADSPQAAGQQPDRSLIPNATATGFTA